jgi:hypothetical protein
MAERSASDAATCRGCGGPTNGTLVYCDECYRKGGSTASAATGRFHAVRWRWRYWIEWRLIGRKGPL